MRRSLLLLLSLPLLAQNTAELAWQAHMTPGPEHLWLAEAVGEWKTVNREWSDASQPPEETVGTAKIEMALGGRYQISHVAGSAMGMPWNGMGMVGYDNTLKLFSATWIDTLGTSITVGSGKRDEKGVLIIKGEMVDPGTGAMLPYRYTTAMEGKDRMVFVMYVGSGAEEFKMMESIYTR